MRLCIDIDGTICKTNGLKYELSSPIVEAIAEVNRLFGSGEYIILFTARGSGSGIDFRELTKQQLADWNVRYHELHFGKPYADIYIDDKAINSDKWIDNLKKGRETDIYMLSKNHHK